MTIHEQWRDFICDPARPARLLSTIGRGVAEAQDQPIDPDILSSFLDRLSGGGADVELLANAIDLSHGGYEDFCAVQLPSLLDALANEHVGRDAVVGPSLRGSPRWDRTFIARRGGRIPRTHFVSRLPSRSFELPENALVKWLLVSLVRAVDAMVRVVGNAALPDRLVRVREAAEAARSHYGMSEVVAPELPTPVMFSAASRQRLLGYRIAGALAQRRVEKDPRRVRGKWFRLLDFLRSNWMQPVETDDLFELFALASVLDVLEEELGLGPAREYGLAMPGRDHVALYDLPDGATLRVFFDQSPSTTVAAPSRYQQTLQAHEGVTGAVARPDVTLVRDPSDGDHPSVMFVEVKETGRTRYASDSIYKAFGYLHDFQALWLANDPGPQVVLLYPEGVGPRPGVAMAEQPLLLLSSWDRSALATAIKMRFAL